MRDTPQAMAAELREACAAHDAAYPDGDWLACNERISAIRRRVNDWIKSSGLWPEGRIAIGNDQALEILVLASEGKTDA